MKVLLIQPQSDAVGFTGLIMGEPSGLEMIGGALDGRHEVKILDLRLRSAISWPMGVSLEENHIRGSLYEGRAKSKESSVGKSG